jgi:hypothetical protein
MNGTGIWHILTSDLDHVADLIAKDETAKYDMIRKMAGRKISKKWKKLKEKSESAVLFHCRFCVECTH